MNKGLDVVTYACGWWRTHVGRPRTLWGVTPILTLPLLVRCDRLLGLRSDSLVFTVYHTSNNFDFNLKRLREFVFNKHPRWALRLHEAILRICLIRYDVFHFFYDHGLLTPTRRLQINEDEIVAMRHFGRRLFTYAYGADVRTRTATLQLGRYNICAECPEAMKFCICADEEGEGNVARIRASATAMIAMGDMLAYVPGARNLHYWPIDTAAVKYAGVTWKKDRPLRIAHAPNHPHFKGTRYLIEAIERLRKEGHAIELVRIEGVPNKEVMALFASCDIIADQFIAGFHGYTALEAMALGKPVLCYLRNPDMAIDPVNCPIINVWPDTVYDVLLDCLNGLHDLATLGRRCRAYVEHYYSLEAVALRLGRLYLAEARFGAHVSRRIARRAAALERNLPPLIAGAPPVPWEGAMAIDAKRVPAMLGEQRA
jgi:glycosyltransferase involved in cell wall biosynthesis